MERLTFNIGSSRGGQLVVAGRARAGETPPAPSRLARVTQRVAVVRERYDWDYLWMLAFTTLLFFRPQDHIPSLGALHLAELTAIGGLGAMAVRRLSSGQTITHVNAEVIGVVGAIWPGPARPATTSGPPRDDPMLNVRRSIYRFLDDDQRGTRRTRREVRALRSLRSTS